MAFRKNTLFTPYVFRLGIQGDSFRSVGKKEMDGQAIDKLQYPLTTKYPKIYMAINEAKEVLYVGYTSDSITNRLRGGLKPGTKDNLVGSHGYRGYKWRVLDEVTFYVWVFDTIDPSFKKEEVCWMFENIEAEIVFALKQQGSWPKYQSEIHFYSEITGQTPLRCEDVFGKPIAEVAQSILGSIPGYGIQRTDSQTEIQ
jgi:hypothetical protein